jgi:hypothetical protein
MDNWPLIPSSQFMNDYLTMIIFSINIENMQYY